MTGIEQAIKYVNQIKNIDKEIEDVVSLVEKITNEDHIIKFSIEPLIGKEEEEVVADDFSERGYPSMSMRMVKIHDMAELGNVLRGYSGGGKKPVKKEPNLFKLDKKTTCIVMAIIVDNLKQRRLETQNILKKHLEDFGGIEKLLEYTKEG